MKDLQISYTNQLNRNRFFFGKKRKRTGTNQTSTDNIWLRAFAGKQLISKRIRFLFRAWYLQA